MICRLLLFFFDVILSISINVAQRYVILVGMRMVGRKEWLNRLLGKYSDKSNKH